MSLEKIQNITFGYDINTDSQYITFRKQDNDWARIWFDSSRIGFDFSTTNGETWTRIWEK